MGCKVIPVTSDRHEGMNQRSGRFFSPGGPTMDPFHVSPLWVNLRSIWESRKVFLDITEES